MTQSSRPQADHIANFPTSDAGPYSADQWAELFQVLFTGDQEATHGPLIKYLNELEVTTAAGDITVDTGAGFCYGHWLVSSATVTFSPTHAIREDRVVLVNNNTNVTYNTNLEFPTVLADYNGTASIEPYSCRLAILTGTGAAAPRPLVNAGGINMVMIAHYDIDGAGAVTGLTDERDFCRYSHHESYQRIEEQVLGAPAATVTFSNIPQFWRSLELLMQCSSSSAGVGDTIELIFNGDAGNNYDYLRAAEFHAATLGTGEGVAVTAAQFASTSSAGSVANYGSGILVNIPNYTGTTFYKTGIVSSGRLTVQASGSLQTQQASFWWRSTAAITSITLAASNGNLVAGSVFTLYGKR